MTSSILPVPVRRITLYTCGVGYFERSGEIEGNAQFTFHFPVGQVNDVLSSLVLVDSGGGTIQPVTYGAQDPVGRSLRAFSVNLSDNPSRRDLLNRMRGASVRVSTHNGAQPITGIVLGVETNTILLQDGIGTTDVDILNLLCGAALQSVRMEHVAAIDIEDQALAEDLRLALAALGKSRDSDKRPLTLSFEGEGLRHVAIGYLTETPAWQTSYRIVIPEAQSVEETGAQVKTALIQGWAIVQNTSQNDWSDVALTLVSGRPISFVQDLYTPLYIHRPTIAPRFQTAPTPQTYGSNLAAVERGFSDEPHSLGAASAAAPAGSGVANVRQRKIAGDSSPGHDKLEKNFARGLITAEEFQAQTAHGAQLGDALFSYAIETPVTVSREESAMIPFLLGETSVTPVSVYNEAVQSDHPLLGVSLTNTTGVHLMGGPITMFTGGQDGAIAYVGEALIDDTEPDQRRIITYAVDLAIEVASEAPEFTTLTVGFAIADGVVKVLERRTRVTKYRIRNHDAAGRSLLIEHRPSAADWKLVEPAKPDERTAKFLRFKRDINPRASEIFTVREQYDHWQSIALTDPNEARLSWILEHGSVTDKQKSAIEAVLAGRRAIAAIEQRMEIVRQKLESINKQQERIRQNMSALDKQSDLYRRYVGQLFTQETEIEGLDAQLREDENALQTHQPQLSLLIAGLEM